MKKLKNILLLLLCGAVFLFFAAGSSSDVTTTSIDDGNGNTKSQSLSSYKLNDDIFINKSTGKYRVKFTKLYESSYRNQFSDKKADRVIIIEYEYENISLDADLNVSDSFNFKLYDKDSNKLETYPADTKYGGDVSQGRKTTASAAYALNNDNNYIELEFYDNIFNSKPDCKVVFEW